MGSNWAQEFRKRVEETEGRNTAVEDFEDVESLAEEETELEEPEDEAEEETGEIKEPEESEAEKAPAKPVVDVGKRAADIFKTMTGQNQLQLKPQPKPSSSSPGGAMMAAMMGLLMLQSLPTIFNTVQSAFRPMTPGGGNSPQNYYPVQCSLCGWKGFGISGMVCPRCGRS